MKKTEYFSIEFNQDKIAYLDQTKLPLEEVYIETSDYERIAVAIENLELRGAPLIGISAAYALALSVKNAGNDKDKIFNQAYNRLLATRPTAVNLFFALDLMRNVYEKNKNRDSLFEELIECAKEIHEQDVEYCKRIGDNSLPLFKKNPMY